MADAPSNLVALRDARQRAEALVAQRYGEDLIDADQLDLRMQRIADAGEMAQLEYVIRDLVDPGTTAAMVLSSSGVSGAARTPGAMALRSPVALADPNEVPSQRKLTCVFSSVEGPGPGPMARRTDVTCVFGHAKLDLRDNEFGPGASVIEVQVLFGALEIEVPRGLPVVIDAAILLGSVERHGQIPSGPRTPDEPHLRITGHVVAGSIEVEDRLSGESRWQARRRRRQERKLAAAERKALGRGR